MNVSTDKHKVTRALDLIREKKSSLLRTHQLAEPPPS